MRPSRRFLLIAAALLVITAVIGGIVLQNAPQTTTVEVQTCVKEGDTCLSLPSVTGSNLDIELLAFPAAFAGEVNLVVMPFDREQQVSALEYVPLFQSLAAENPGVAYYSLAALPDLAAPIRLMVTGGMNMAVSEPAIRRVTIIFYLENQPEFIRALNVSDTEAIQVFIFNRAGEVLHQQSGDYSDAAAQTLTEALAKINPGEK
jgi:hypothetical protein